MADDDKKEDPKDEAKNILIYPLIRFCDMSEEVRMECAETCQTACEKFSDNNENAAKMVKETLDQKCGNGWQVVIGEGYGFEVTYDKKCLMYMYFGGNTAILVWKCC